MHIYLTEKQQFASKMYRKIPLKNIRKYLVKMQNKYYVKNYL